MIKSYLYNFLNCFHVYFQKGLFTFLYIIADTRKYSDREEFISFKCFYSIIFFFIVYHLHTEEAQRN